MVDKKDKVRPGSISSSKSMGFGDTEKRKEEKSDYETTKGHEVRENLRKRASKETWDNPRNPKHEPDVQKNEDANPEEKKFEKEGFGQKGKPHTAQKKVRSGSPEDYKNLKNVR